MIETIFFSFVLAKIKGYKLLPIFKHWSIYPVIFMALTYVYLESMIWRGDYSLIIYSNVFKSVYLGCFLLLAIQHDKMKVFFYSIPFVWLGTALNTIVIRANGGKMPVFPSNSWATGYVRADTFSKALPYGDFHVLGNMYSKLIPLTDVWDFGWSIMSIGDIFIRVFVFLIVYHSIKASSKTYQDGI